METSPVTDSGSKVASPKAGFATTFRARKRNVVEVVLVDDSLPVRERVAASLEAVDGVTVTGQASDVPSGLRLLEERQPDVLVLDLELPGQSGIDLLKIAQRRGFATMIIMLSIHDHPKLREKCAALGAAYYFHKLNELENAAEVCRDLVSKRRGQK